MLFPLYSEFWKFIIINLAVGIFFLLLILLGAQWAISIWKLIPFFASGKHAITVDLNVVSQTWAENQMKTCGVHLDGTLFLPVQGRTPRVPVKAAKGSRAERSQASSFIRVRSKQANYKSGSCGYLCIALGSGGTLLWGQEEPSVCLLLISLFRLTICFSSLSILVTFKRFSA